MKFRKEGIMLRSQDYELSMKATSTEHDSGNYDESAHQAHECQA